jgi:hypothetical protein
VIFRHIPWYSGIPGFLNALFSRIFPRFLAYEAPIAIWIRSMERNR